MGYPTAEASALLHNAWLATYYTHAPTIPELLRATVTLDGDLNGPLWMMKYILLGTCIIYLYNTVEQKLPFRLFQFSCLAVFVYSFFHLPEPNFFHVHLVLMGLILRKLDDALKAWLTQHEKDGHPLLRFFFLLLVLLPIALDAGGLQRILYPFFRAHCPSIAPVFIWNAYWVMLFSFSLIVGVMNCPPLQRALEWAPLKRVAPMNFAVYLVHFPLIASLSLHLCLRLVNRISYSKVFVILTVVSFAALFLTSWLYEQSIGKLQDKIVKKITARLAK